MIKFTAAHIETLEKIILARRDVRGNRFVDTPVSQKDIDKILFAGVNAPSVGFSQPWEFVVIKDLEIRNKIKESFTMKEAGVYSVVCAIQNMWLMARALDIGLGWVSILDPNKIKSILNAPNDRQLIGYLCLGHVDKFYENPELERLQWEKRKNINDVVIKESY